MNRGTVMSFAKNYAGLVKVIAKLLNQTGLKGRKFRTADLAAALKLIADADQEVPVDGKLINGAFKLDDKRSVVPLHLLIVSLDSNDRVVLYVEKKRDREVGGRGKGERRYTHWRVQQRGKGNCILRIMTRGSALVYTSLHS